MIAKSFLDSDWLMTIGQNHHVGKFMNINIARNIMLSRLRKSGLEFRLNSHIPEWFTLVHFLIPVFTKLISDWSANWQMYKIGR